MECLVVAQEGYVKVSYFALQVATLRAKSCNAKHRKKGQLLWVNVHSYVQNCLWANNNRTMFSFSEEVKLKARDRLAFFLSMLFLKLTWWLRSNALMTLYKFPIHAYYQGEANKSAPTQFSTQYIPPFRVLCAMLLRSYYQLRLWRRFLCYFANALYTMGVGYAVN